MEFEEGPYEISVLDSGNSLRRTLRNDPARTEPRDVDGLLDVLRFQTLPRRTALHLHIPLPQKGIAVRGQSLPNLPSSARAVFSSSRKTQETAVRADLVQTVETPWVLEGAQTLKFSVVKNSGFTLK